MSKAKPALALLIAAALLGCGKFDDAPKKDKGAQNGVKKDKAGEKKTPTETVGGPLGFHLANLEREYNADVIAYGKSYHGKYVLIGFAEPSIGKDDRGYFIKENVPLRLRDRAEAERLSEAMDKARKEPGKGKGPFDAGVGVILRFIPDEDGFGFHDGTLVKASRSPAQ